MGRRRRFRDCATPMCKRFALAFSASRVDWFHGFRAVARVLRGSAAPDLQSWPPMPCLAGSRGRAQKRIGGSRTSSDRALSIMIVAISRSLPTPSPLFARVYRPRSRLRQNRNQGRRRAFAAVASAPFTASRRGHIPSWRRHLFRGRMRPWRSRGRSSPCRFPPWPGTP